MKKYLAALSCLVGLVCLLGLPALADNQMVTDRTKQSIEVGTRFSGERIYFFGTVPDPEAEVVVKLVPKHSESIKLTQKGKVVLFWMGVKQFEVGNMPPIYKIHSSRPLQDFVTPELAKKYKIGYQALEQQMELKLLKGTAEPDDRKIMFDGFIKLKEKENLYRVGQERIRITKGRLFEHYFTFPDKAGEGDYLVESFAIKNGQVIGSSTDVIQVRKVGMISWLSRTAKNNGVFYGILAVIIALGVGLLVGMVFKGGGH